MTVIRPNSISGINSITANGGDINLFRADGTAADVTVNNITGVAVTFWNNWYTTTKRNYSTKSKYRSIITL